MDTYRKKSSVDVVVTLLLSSVLYSKLRFSAVVLLLLNMDSKQPRSCWDGQLRHFKGYSGRPVE